MRREEESRIFRSTYFIINKREAKVAKKKKGIKWTCTTKWCTLGVTKTK